MIVSVPFVCDSCGHLSTAEITFDESWLRRYSLERRLLMSHDCDRCDYPMEQRMSAGEILQRGAATK